MWKSDKPFLCLHLNLIATQALFSMRFKRLANQEKQQRLLCCSFDCGVLSSSYMPLPHIKITLAIFRMTLHNTFFCSWLHRAFDFIKLYSYLKKKARQSRWYIYIRYWYSFKNSFSLVGKGSSWISLVYLFIATLQQCCRDEVEWQRGLFKYRWTVPLEGISDAVLLSLHIRT